MGITAISRVCIVLLLASAAYPAEASEGKQYWLMSGLTFFINNPEGVGFDADIAIKDMKVIGRAPLEVLVRLEGPDGRVIFREEVAPLNPKPPVADRDGRAALLRRAAEFVQDRNAVDALPSRTVRLRVPAGRAGVYRLTVLGTWDDIIRLSLSKPLKYGVMSQGNHLAGIGDDYAESYVYVPRDSYYIDLWVVEGFAEDDCTADAPLLGGRTATVETPDGKRIAVVSDRTGRAAEIGATRYDRPYRPTRFCQVDVASLADQVLKLRIARGAPFKLHMAMGYKRSMYGRGDSFNAILCPDEETARAIHGGTTYYPTGGMALNPWQTRMHDYVAKTRVDDYRLTDPDGSLLELKIADEEWERVLLMNRFMPGPGPWESVADGIKKLPKAIEDAVASMKDPKDIHEFYWNAPLPGWMALYLGYLYKYPLEGNPFYHHPAALNLCLLGTCRMWMSMGLGNQGCSRQTQGISIAYDMGGYWPYWEVARFAADYVPAELMASLRDGMLACADRIAHDFFMHYNNMNQITCIPMRMYAAYLTAGDERIAGLAKRLLYRVLDQEFGADSGQFPSGDYAEGWAHDTTYGGYSMTEIARYWLLTKDPRALDSVKRAFHLFNHICMPDNTATPPWSNPTVWASRYGGNVQFWGEGYNYVASALPEAARYVGPNSPTSGNPPKWQAGVTPPELPADIAFTVCDWKSLKRAEWAGASPEDFTRDINNGHEFYAVKRRAYYALVFAGRLHPPLEGKVQGMGGGGIALVWTAKAGPAIIGKVLQEYGCPVEQRLEYRANGMVGSYDGGNPIIAHSSSMPDSKLTGNTLTISGECRRQPYRMERIYQFSDAAIEVASALLDNAPGRRHTIDELYEAIPLQDAKAELFGADGKSLGALSRDPVQDVASIRVGEPGKGLTIRLDRPRPVQLGGKSAVLVKLPGGDAVYSDGGIRLSYTIEPD